MQLDPETNHNVNQFIRQVKADKPDIPWLTVIREINQKFGVELSENAARKRYARYKKRKADVKEEVSHGTTDGVIELLTDSEWETGVDGEEVNEVAERESKIDELLSSSGIDKELWEVLSADVKRYEMPLKNGPDETRVHIAYSVRAKIKPIGLGMPLSDLFDRVAEMGLIELSGLPDPANSYDDVLFVPSLYDVHLEKLATARSKDTNESLPLTYLSCLSDLISTAKKAGPYGHTLFVMGNDFGHIDNLAGTTTRGTSVSTSMTYDEGIALRCNLSVAAILKMREESPVTVISVPGNHEENSSLWLARYIQAYFRHDEHVNVIISDSAPRVYFRWGDVQFMFTHGDGFDPKKAVGVMFVEDRENFAATSHKEVFTGHFHTYKTLAETLSDEFGVVVRFMPALSKTDRWHEKHQFIGSRRGAIGMLFHSKHGWMNEFPSFV